MVNLVGGIEETIKCVLMEGAYNLFLIYDFICADRGTSPEMGKIVLEKWRYFWKPMLATILQK